MELLYGWLQGRKWRLWMWWWSATIVLSLMYGTGIGHVVYGIPAYHDVVCVKHDMVPPYAQSASMVAQCPAQTSPFENRVSVGEVALVACLMAAMACLAPCLGSWELIHDNRIRLLSGIVMGVTAAIPLVVLGAGQMIVDLEQPDCMLVNVMVDCAVAMIAMIACGLIRGVAVAAAVLAINVLTQQWQVTWPFQLRGHAWSCPSSLLLLAVLACLLMIGAIVSWSVWGSRRLR